jgi:cytochrome c-type biogenesis protein CcmH
VSAAARLKGWPGWILLAFVVAGLLAVGSTRDDGPQTPDDRVASITRRVACPVCEGESVYESRNTASENIRNAVEERVDAGQMSDDEIIAYVQSRQDASILLVPENSGLDALVWAIPAVAGACAIGGLAMAFRRWRDAERGTSDPTDADRQLVAEALADPAPEDGPGEDRQLLAPSPTSWDDAPKVDGDARG